MKKKMEMGDPNPLVSVILPFYNSPFLREAVESILTQSYSNFELILIDNGSTDNSSKIAHSYSEEPRVQIVQESQQGVVHAANKGIETAKGDFIARMDSDDIAYGKRLEKQVKFFNDNPSMDVASSLIDYLGPENNEGFIHYVKWLNSVRTTKEIYLNQFVEFPLANPSIMFKRKIFERFGFYSDGDFPEDYEFFLRLLGGGIKIGKVPQSLLEWRDSENRLTRTDAKYSPDAFFRIKSKYLAKWLLNNNPFHPDVYLWGAGRLSRRRSDYLIEQGINVVKYIDLKESNHVIHYEDIPESSNAFIVSYVGNRGAREEIRQFLYEKGYIEGENYILAS